MGSANTGDSCARATGRKVEANNSQAKSAKKRMQGSLHTKLRARWMYSAALASVTSKHRDCRMRLLNKSGFVLEKTWIKRVSKDTVSTLR